MIPIRDTIPSRGPALAVGFILAANIAVHLWISGLAPGTVERLFYLFGLVPRRFTHPAWAVMAGFPLDEWWPFLTHMFIHGGLFHLVANMWTLWIFGDNVEDRMGSGRFLLFYIAGGLCAAGMHTVFNPEATVPAVGASGAVAAVMGAYMVLFPRSTIVVLVPILFVPLFFEVPAVFFLLVWFASQVLSGTASLTAPAAAGGIAWWAHIGGFVFGLLAHSWFTRPERPRYDDEWGIEGGWRRPLPRHADWRYR